MSKISSLYVTQNETNGYQTVTDPANTPPTMLIAGSQNVLIDQQKKVKSRAGYTLFGAPNAALTPVKYQAPTWNSSNGDELPMRPYNDVLEVYLGTVDGVKVDAYTQVMNALNPDNPVRFGTWFDSDENEDVLLFVNGDENIYEWGGGVAIVDSVSNSSGILETIDGPNTATGPSSGGVDYAIGDILTISTGGANATIEVDAILYGGIKTVGVGSGGSSYVVNDVLAVSGGGGTARLKVTSVSGGVITGLSILAAGSGYFSGIYATTGGTGTGATVSITATGNTISAWHIVNAGTGYSTGSGNATTTTGSGTGATINITAVATGAITKKGTRTFGEARFYATRNMTLFCVRTGKSYTYTGGVGSLTLIGMGDTSALQAGDILLQAPVVQSSKPAPPTHKSRTNDTIFVFNNQLYLGSDTDNLAYISKNTSYYDFSYSTPRLTGEGGLMTLDKPVRAFGTVGKSIIVFAGRENMYAASFQKLSVPQNAANAIIAETLSVQKINAGVDQGAQSQEFVIPIGNELMYLSFEPALRIIKNPTDVWGIDPATYSNPIKPDFDGIDWTGGSLLWFKNAAYISAPKISRLYILEFMTDANGKNMRFWQAPQLLPVGALSIISDALYGHSNAVPETYALFDGGADRDYAGIATADRIPFKAVAFFAYSFEFFMPTRTKGYIGANRSLLKTFDRYYSEGEIEPGSTVKLNLYYDYGGATQVLNKSINGEDSGIVQEDMNLSSLGQGSFGTQPLGGSSVEPSNKLRYKVIFDIPQEDYYILGEEYSCEQVDQYFSILSRGPNATLSGRRDPNISR